MSDARLVIQNIGGVTVVDFGGTVILDGTTIQSINRQLAELVDKQAQRKLLLEFSQVKFLSSSLLGVLIAVQKKVAQMKGRVVIAGLKPELRRVFQIAKVDGLFEFYDDQEPGLNSFGVHTNG